ncbi:MAG: polysaccharide biosynthesis tyrosine autokinase [Pseudolabrys sp.]
MNAPNFSMGSDRPAGLPSVTAEPRQVAPDMGRGVATRDPYGPEIEPEDSNYRALFFKYLGLALKHRWMILGVLVAALLIGFGVTYTSTPLYRATATIQVDRDVAKVVKVDAPDTMADVGDNARFYQTQYDLLKSRSLAQKVAADLDLGNASTFLNPKSSSPWARLRESIVPARPAATGDVEARKAAAAGMVQGGISVEPAPNSRLVRISYVSPDPEWAYKIANGIADSFIGANLDRRYGASAYARTFLKERLEELKIKLEESERALVAYADKEQILTVKGQPSIADSDLSALQSELQKVRTERITAQELWEQADKSKGLALPQLLNDKSIQLLRDRRAALMGDYQDKLALFKPDYPDMRKIKAQIDQIDRDIDGTSKAIKDSLKANYEALLRHETLLQQNIEQARSSVLDSRNKNIQFQILQRESDTNRSLYDGLLQQYKDVGVAGAVGTNNIAIIDRAERPGGPFSPSLQKNLLISILLGLFAAAAVIAVLEILDDTFKTPEEIEAQLGLPVLGIIPLAEGDILSTIRDTPISPIAEAYRSFRTALQFSTDHGAPKTLVVTSPRPGEGKSTTSVALAVNFAQLGMRVLLIDADMRNPSAHKVLKRDNAVGLANYLAGIAMAPDAFQKTDINGLTFMATGPLPPNPAELLSGPKMLTLISLARESFDVVIIDAPPILGLADAPLLASIAAGTLLVLGSGETRRGVVKASLKRLHFARARVVGAVLNKFNFRTASYGYGSTYGYGYGYGYGELDHYGYGAQTAAQVEHSPKS